MALVGLSYPSSVNGLTLMLQSPGDVQVLSGTTLQLGSKSIVTQALGDMSAQPAENICSRTL